MPLNLGEGEGGRAISIPGSPSCQPAFYGSWIYIRTGTTNTVMEIYSTVSRDCVKPHLGIRLISTCPLSFLFAPRTAVRAPHSYPQRKERRSEMRAQEIPLNSDSFLTSPSARLCGRGSTGLHPGPGILAGWAPTGLFSHPQRPRRRGQPGAHL